MGLILFTNQEGNVLWGEMGLGLRTRVANFWRCPLHLDTGVLNAENKTRTEIMNRIGLKEKSVGISI